MRRALLGDLKVGDRFTLVDRCPCVYSVMDEPDQRGMRRAERIRACKMHVDDDSGATIPGHISADVDALD